MNKLQNEFPFTTLIASGPSLGMPEGTVGNSEIGHIHMGIGRRVVSDRVRIFEAIETGEFYRIGGSKKHHVQTRIVSATNKDLNQMVEKES